MSFFFEIDFFKSDAKVAHVVFYKCFHFVKDKANKNGGKWIVRLKKGLASRCWENLVSDISQIFSQGVNISNFFNQEVNIRLMSLCLTKVHIPFFLYFSSIFLRNINSLKAFENSINFNRSFSIKEKHSNIVYKNILKNLNTMYTLF